MVRVRNLVLAIAAASALTASNMVLALGVGEIRLESSLNQPLLADIELLDLRGLMASEIKPKLASVEDFKKLGIERPYTLTDLTFTPMQRSDGRYVIRVTSSKPMREPYLSFLVEVLWPSGRLLREYTLLFDPPLYAPEAATQAPHLPGSRVAPVAPPSPSAVAATPAATPTPPINTPSERGSTSGGSSNGASAPRATSVPAQVHRARGREYQVVSRDTLWGISEQVREVGSVHQNMAAIWDLNQEAFVGGNINRIQTGKILRLPTADQVTSRSHPEAVVEVSRHTARWRRSPTASQDARSVAATTPNRPEPKDNLRLVAAAHAGRSGAASPSAKNPTESKNNDAEVQALRDELATAQEGLDSSRRESEELKDRLNDLQSQLDKLTRLMQLKDNQLAELQNQLGATAKAQAAKSEQEDSLAQFWTNPLLLGGIGGGALITALLALLARRKGSGSQTNLAAPQARHHHDDDPVLTTTPTPLKSKDQDDSLDRFGLTAPRSSRTEDVGLELLDKAETFMSYRQFNEAASVLRKAVVANPDRLEPHFKLMEVYGELQDREGFLREEAALRDLGAPDTRIRSVKSRFPALGAVAARTTTSERPLVHNSETAGLDFEALLDESAHPEVPARSSLLGSEDDRQSSDLAAAMRAAKQRETLQSSDSMSQTQTKAAEDPFADFDWELPEPKLSSASVQAAASDASPTRTFDIKEETSPSPKAKATMPDAFDLSQEEPPSAAQAPDSDNEEVTTQLDLAKAYAEMGDKEGALDILKEVMSEGSERQKQIARQIVSTLIK